jgi:DNA-directed RNA polymerase subunit E'/Rpb7
MKFHLKMSEIGVSTKLNLERKIVQRTEGKCIPEGYVRPDSVKIITYSSGVIKMNLVEFQVVFECLICNPVEGQIVECTTKSITKAGIHAEVMTDRKFIPMKIFVARDHNYANRMFGDVKEDETISVRIIGKRFELNDPYIVAIASLMDAGKKQQPLGRHPQAKPRITVLDNAQDNMEDADEYIEPEEMEPESELIRNADRAPISVPTLTNTNIIRTKK